MKTSNQITNPKKFQEVYSQFNDSVNSMADLWFGLTELEKTNFVKANNLVNLENVFEWIDNACNSARELPKEVANVDETKEEIAAFLLRYAIILLNYEDKFGLKLKDYLQIIHELKNINSMENYHENQCHCTDRSLANMVIEQKSNGKYELFTVSEVRGMGNAEYNKKVLNEEFDDIVPFNSISGISHVALLTNKVWRIIQITDDGTIEGKWRWLNDIQVDTFEEVKAILKTDTSY
jgi:hypothetical protein